MKIQAIVLGVLLLAAPMLAADIDGKWTGSIDTPMGASPVSFTFKADGAMLTGTATGIDGSEVPIKDGKIEANNISFNVTFDFGGMPLMLSYTGVMAADQIQLKADLGGMPFEFVVKKEK